MAGALFIVNIPRLNESDCKTQVEIEKEKKDQTSKLVDELKDNKLFNIRTRMESRAEGLKKCQSADCLHNNEKVFIKDEHFHINDLNLPNTRYFTKGTSSWDNEKQAKSRKNKLKITPGGVDIFSAFHWDTPLETILSEILWRLNIKNAAWTTSGDNSTWQVTFSLHSGNLCEELLQVLQTFGIGSRQQSSVSVVPCALYYAGTSQINNASKVEGDPNSAWSRFSSSVRARNNLAQVLNVVRAEAALTFDWVFLLLVAAFVAAIGLVEDSTVILVASMLISPLMGPITAATLGTAVKDRSLQRMGLMHELFGLFLSLVIGFLFGLAICAMYGRYGAGDWPTYEMTSRCEIRSLWVGVLVAIPSGAAVALAVLGEYTSSLVGVAISASLLPPAVNAGLLWAMSLIHLIRENSDPLPERWPSSNTVPRYSENRAIELAIHASLSLSLTLLNIVCIYLVGVAVYKIKEVCPQDRRNISWWKVNKNNFQSSKAGLQKPEIMSTVPWNLYNKWQMKSEDIKDEEAKEKKDVYGVAQSETVTYRQTPQPSPANVRFRAQSIESFYKRKGQLYEKSPQNTALSAPSSPTKLTNPDFNRFDNSSNYRKTSESLASYGIYNTGFENMDSLRRTSGLDTTIVLGSQSFNV